MGRWPNKFTLLAGGQVMATVDKKNWSMSTKYWLDVPPGVDVLLAIAIACGIDRIHHEVEDERRRRHRQEEEVGKAVGALLR